MPLLSKSLGRCRRDFAACAALLALLAGCAATKPPVAARAAQAAQLRGDRGRLAMSTCALFGEARTAHCWGPDGRLCEAETCRSGAGALPRCGGWPAKLTAAEPSAPFMLASNNEPEFCAVAPLPTPITRAARLWSFGDLCASTTEDRIECMRSSSDEHGETTWRIEVSTVRASDVRSFGAYLLLEDGSVIDQVGQSYVVPPPRGPSGTLDWGADVRKVRIERRFVAIASGKRHSCGLDAEGSVFCWGDNMSGALGVGDRALESCEPWREADEPPSLYCTDTPQPVAIDGKAVALDAGYNATCVVLEDSGVQCWGTMFAGRGSRVATPMRIAGLTGAVSVSVSDRYGCAILKNGSVACWGKNEHATLGDGTTEDRAHAAPAVGLSDVVELAAEQAHVCAITSDLALWCWGANAFGELGNGTFIGSTVPIRTQPPGTISPQ